MPATGENPSQIMIIESDAALAKQLAASVRAAAFGGREGACTATVLGSINELRTARLRPFSLIVTGDDLADGTGMDVLRDVLSRTGPPPVVVLTDDFSWSHVRELTEAGAADCLPRSGDAGALIAGITAKVLIHEDERREARQVERELRATVASLRIKNKKIEETLSDLESMVWTDPLTGLANRRHVQERLPQLFAEAVRYGTDLSVLMIDLDSFKHINDTLGHARGDDILQLSGHLVAEQVRTADVAARFGGDEFLVLMPRTSAETAAQVAQRIKECFTRNAAMCGAGTLHCGMSIGVASLSVSQPMTGDELINHADNALYAAKQSGKGKIYVCGPDGVNAEPMPAAA